jgi:uncharacterized protein (TIGR04222 family)
MNDTWGIPGPVFAAIYLGLVLFPAVTAVIATLRALAGRRGSPTRLEQVAILAGGPQRVADTVIATLMERDRLRLDSAGRLHVTSRHAAGELGDAAIALIGSSSATPDRIRVNLESHPAVESLVTELTGAGLLVDARRLRRAWTFAAVAYAAVVALGIARLVAGIAAAHPVGYLVALLFLAVVAGGGATAAAAHRFPVRPTKAGRAALATAREDGNLVRGTTGAVAVGGLPNHPDQAVRRAVSTPVSTRPGRRAGRTSAGMAAIWMAGSSGGASCGGGGASCGGGGGGGCGG